MCLVRYSLSRFQQHNLFHISCVIKHFQLKYTISVSLGSWWTLKIETTPNATPRCRICADLSTTLKKTMMWNAVPARSKKLKLLHGTGLTVSYRLSVCVLHSVFYSFINCIFVTFWSSLAPVLTSWGANYEDKALSSIIERFN